MILDVLQMKHEFVNTKRTWRNVPGGPIGVAIGIHTLLLLQILFQPKKLMSHSSVTKFAANGVFLSFHLSA
jgi:hypothetical protein